MAKIKRRKSDAAGDAADTARPGGEQEEATRHTRPDRPRTPCSLQRYWRVWGPLSGPAGPACLRSYILARNTNNLHCPSSHLFHGTFSHVMCILFQSSGTSLLSRHTTVLIVIPRRLRMFAYSTHSAVDKHLTVSAGRSFVNLVFLILVFCCSCGFVFALTDTVMLH